ncbi:TM1802 family CRISPR-associated protein [Halegenticoccus tardaugens]|uniref:TM1802 family CRISPR-associated protein n=1 Tax=Halegenticoccus tardaugens TaxID=2071624 RepID=UPI00100AE3E2|nr:TM1802 family CRISPR-associated protein [Halegenticoccus tardaugens]
MNLSLDEIGREQTDLAAVSDEEIEAALPDRPPASLFDIAYLYTTLDTLARTATVEGIDRSYVPYMTPGSKTEVFVQIDADGDHAGNPNVLAARIVIEDGEARLDDDEPVVAKQFAEDDVYRLGYSTVASKSSHTTVYSATFHKSGNALKVTDALVDQLVKWTAKDGVAEARAEDEYAEVLSPLSDLGDDEEAAETLREAAWELFGLDENSIKGDEPTDKEISNAGDGIIGDAGMFVTLAIRTEGDDEFRYPGEVPAMNEAMARNRSAKLKEGKSATKGMDAYGAGVCLVLDEKEEVYGGSGTPMATSAAKQWGIFDDMNPGSAHRTRPLSRDTANALAGAQGLLDKFRTKLDLGQHLYLLPYPDSLDVDAVRDLYVVLDAVRDGDGLTEVDLVPHVTDEDELSLYAYLLTFENNSVRLPQFEAPRIVKTRGRKLSEAHTKVVSEWVFADQQGPFARYRRFWEKDDNKPGWVYSTSGPLVLSVLARQQYFAPTVTRPDLDAGTDATTMTYFPHLDFSFRLFEGDAIAASELFDQFAQKCIDYQRTAFEEGWDATPRIATTQYLQACAVAAVDGLNGYAPRDHDYDYNMTDRDSRLDSFIKSHAALRDDEERQSAFLLGGLVGRLSAFQRNNGTSNTLMRRHPVASLTERSFADVAADVMELNNVYSETESDGKGIMNQRYTERLMDVGQKTAPADWDIDRSDLRYHYALGLTYGAADTFVDGDSDENKQGDD